MNNFLKTVLPREFRVMDPCLVTTTLVLKLKIIKGREGK